MIKLDRAAVADATRATPGFRAYTVGLTRSAEKAGLAASRAKGIRRRTGEYEGGFRAVFRQQRGDVLGRLLLENEAAHSVFLEGGTRRHVITPRRARVLRFTVGGRTVYAMRVNHPGTKPRWVIRDTLRGLAKARVNL